MQDRIYYDPQSGVMAVAGSSSFSDWLFVDPVMALGGLQWTERYNHALAMYEKYKPSVMIGHSLGSQIVSAINDADPKFESRGGKVRLYSAPRIKFVESRSNVVSYRHVFDPISLMDRAAKQTLPTSWNPHDY